MRKRSRRSLSKRGARRTQTLYAGIWTVFLVYPIEHIAGNPELVTSQRVLGLVSIGLFVLIYLVGFWLGIDTLDTWFSRRWMPRWPWAFLAVLCVLNAGVAVVDPTAAMEMFAYPLAFTLFLMPASAVLTVLVLEVAAILVARIVNDQQQGWLMAVPSMAMILAAGFISRVWDNNRLEQDKQHKIEATYAERERIASDVHDLLGQSLTVMSMKAELIGRLIDIDPEAAKDQAEDLHTLSREALGQVRGLVSDLNEADLDSQLATAATALATADISLRIRDERTGESEHDAVRGWVLREAVTNVVRHSQAKHCWIELSDDVMCITDDGIGVGDAKEGSGRAGMRRRVESIGGRLDIGPGDNGRGTKVVVS
ncbi:histidine kinase [Cutibacterium equinum]|uniref:Histidine kinase n=1 Tax=Cutibacterium equinum TaxID=3016342 RepID=A0ABY7R121_9ACTN|nr:histidine kinase [Cutibacterium equinum]WCC80313.1 histidine kinase [Cutibacterium equinum]